jgi:SulP family sulfate permease
VTFFANSESIRTAVRARAAAPGTKGVVIDAEAILFVDITAVRMLDDLADDLARDGQRLATAHDLGQVGDLLGTTETSSLCLFRTIDEAMAAVRA